MLLMCACVCVCVCVCVMVQEESERLSQREDRVAERECKVVSIECLLHEAYATLQQYTEEELSLKWKQFKEVGTQCLLTCVCMQNVCCICSVHTHR